MVRGGGGVRGGCNNAEPINNKEWPQNHTCVRSAILFLRALLLDRLVLLLVHCPLSSGAA